MSGVACDGAAPSWRLEAEMSSHESQLPTCASPTNRRILGSTVGDVLGSSNASTRQVLFVRVSAWSANSSALDSQSKSIRRQWLTSSWYDANAGYPAGSAFAAASAIAIGTLSARSNGKDRS